jgi:hypothetical protein
MTSILLRMLLVATLARGATGVADAAKDLVVGVPDNLTGLDLATCEEGGRLLARAIAFEAGIRAPRAGDPFVPQEAERAGAGGIGELLGTRTAGDTLRHHEALPRAESE